MNFEEMYKQMEVIVYLQGGGGKGIQTKRPRVGGVCVFSATKHYFCS